ncbi:ArgE/DapE family deacylase [Loigolactobacillus backii]|uniref:Probable succinyl-diaminopimelate desuccinylase n=1 Tax=Loigolactobacillus backii TaxID=375175 RepID=A0A192H2S0_9LACO|nr:ArgE/DapE family deacylase [Loigolactobacillus backii]ANK62246.1 succinyl-diaminopimelate desuccinylase [Loigolactobacillus backii]ANK70740.1 succinyl-diaminopimelate desuccinylase [Loigolactobacillus backii]MDA5387657.1 ArgE/DapE family deacylase [Loigolactobacillus backii]MDA5390186.1 ArgE/DapE family deacylase [Loigolactobacillus backii]
MKRENALSILKKLIQIKSVNQNEATVADYIADLFHPYPAAQVTRVEYAPGRTNLVITVNGQADGKIIGLAGHTDVVAPGDVANWKYPPFSGTEAMNKIYGRGATDMKSGLAAMVCVLLDLLAAGTPFNGKIRLFATVGEETGEYGAAQLTKQGFADDLDALIIGEPSNLNVEYTHRGVIDYTVMSVGKSAHSAEPQRGINAIQNLLLFYPRIQALMASKDQVDPVLGGLLHNITLISGGDQINSIPARAMLSGNVRTIPAYPTKNLMTEITQLVAELNQIDGVHLEITYHYPESPLPGNPKAPFVQLVKQIAAERLDREIPVVGDSGATDASEFIHAAKRFPIVIFGPGNDSGHQVDENVVISNYLAAIQIYHQVIDTFLK